ncbi:probable LRR receptor-like serine/threonine-protein kinase At3g47570 [Vicia villosa]|uniref:probable LRR receptor-like serine/threonine-protein kinase At3g47570 n=1 Tax=Vicia villosa TaxID=3911 RepID=UPI00273A9887|nr:probable LRR receptor-like serine/threonine-protein kinase At3g47570 [Vicia villosa]
MKPFPLLSPILLYLHLLFLFTLTLICFGPNKIMAATILGNQTDHLSLLQFKESISSDPYRILDSWNESTHFCNWHGITCHSKHQRVTKMMLQGYKLHGPISPYIGNLSRLRNLNLEENTLFGNIPQELGRLLHLHGLFLSNNSLAGEIPTILTNCSNLVDLFLFGNNLTGKIPSQIFSLQKLQLLNIGKNNLIGGVPSFIGNISSLTALGVAYNNLEGHIPREICHLTNLIKMNVGINKLSGMFPPCLYNMSSLTLFSAASNRFGGSLPPNMFQTLSNLQEIHIDRNEISGPIPTSIANASTLRIFSIDANHFVGQVPSLGRLHHLYFLNLEINHLGDKSTQDLEFLKTLTNCSKLYVISIGANNFGGQLPNSVGNLSSQLSRLYVGGNEISGKVPPELGNLVNLILLTMESNHFEGIIPTSFRKLQNIQVLDLRQNNLSGSIPSSIGNLTQLFDLRLSENMLEGNIPPSIGKCQRLEYLNLSRNNLQGAIPLEVFEISTLSRGLDLSQNSLSGSLPNEVGLLKNIENLVVSQNNLSGEIPSTIGECITLENLNLQGNSFQGTIPSNLASLKGLQYLDLSRNRLSGSIPDVIQDIPDLKHLNVSFNMLEGEVPIGGVFGNATQVALIGNNKLCGGISELHLPPCPIKGRKHKNKDNFKLIGVIVSVVSFLLILSFIITIYWMRNTNQKPSFDSPTIDQLTKVSYQELHRGTDGFSDRNLIGSGSFGFVYRGNLMSQDNVVAVKVLNLQKKGAHKSFIAECNALKSIRHRNLVKILTCCSSTDHKGQEFKALVYDYMKNGSLEQWLHPEILNAELPKKLDLTHRLNIITDVASALHYLHQECEQLVLHCDLKPSNVLLDDDMIAHVSDFGIARLVSTIDGNSLKDTSTIGIKGTVGYAPPEYGMGSEVSTSGDMYSFGILVLEMLTGRRPTDEVFEDGQNLHNFVAISFPDNLIKILDPHLISRDAEVATLDRNRENLIQNVEECLVSVFKIGLICSMQSQKERMNIVDVTRELSIIKKTFLSGIHTNNQ